MGIKSTMVIPSVVAVAGEGGGGGGGDGAIKQYTATSYTTNSTLFTNPIAIPTIDDLTEEGTYLVTCEYDYGEGALMDMSYIVNVAAVKVSGTPLAYLQNMYVGPGGGDSVSIARMGVVGEGSITWADWSGNSLLEKQDKTLSSAITVGGVSQTTVEGALGAINTVAAAGLQNKTDYPDVNINICPAATNNYGVSYSNTVRINPQPPHSNYGIPRYAAIVGYNAGPMQQGTQYSNIVAIGYQARNDGNYSVAVGNQANASGGTGEYGAAVAVGSHAYSSGGVALGGSAQSGYGIAIGAGYDSSHKVTANSYKSIAIGIVSGTTNDDQVQANANGAIQLGNGINATANTFQVYSYPMLDGTTGKIPMARLPIVQLTQADYDALVAGGTVDANTIYCIIPD